MRQFVEDMRFTSLSGLIAAAVSAGAYSQPTTTFNIQVSIADQANIRAQNMNCPGFTNGHLYPLGDAVYAGIPFRHGPADRYAFMGGPYCGDPPRALERQFSAPGTATIYCLLNAWNGCGTTGPEFLFQVFLSDGTIRSWTLQNGVDYRDHNGSCPLTGIRSQQVWSSGFGQRLDMLTLRVESPGKLITGIRVESTDPSSPLAAPFVFGMTVVDSEDCNGDGIVDYAQILDGTFADVNSNGIPDSCECPADLNASNTVDAEDLAYILFAWGTDGGKTPGADINDDGTVDANDLSVVLGSWGPCP